MKILQINSVCGIGSTGRIVAGIHDILIKNGHESYIACGRNLYKNFDNAIKIGTSFDVYMHVLKTRIFDKHGFGSKKATIKFINKVENLNPDIIHLHNIHGYYVNIEVLFNYLKTANKPVIWTLHDCWAFTGHCSYFDYVNCDKWKTGCYKCPQKTKYPKSILLSNSKHNYLKKKEIFTDVKNMIIVTPSNWLAKLVRQSFLKEYPVKVINNGIDLTVFKPVKSDFRKKYNLEGKFIILGIANVWEKRKGYKYFIELAQKLEKDEIIVMVGLTKRQIKKLTDNIIGITKTNSVKELVKIYSSADVFVNPTLEDNFPTTNLEALACGTPVITFNTGGSVESVDSNTGFVVEKGSIDGLLNAIKVIKEKGKKSYSYYCVERVRKLYNKHNAFNEYMSLYRITSEKILKCLSN
ncbi:glycosyltransferase family 4 protein [Thermosipho sp. 1070]|uniref:glycosyltransferase family 4 protein n=1 Tax=Thermosipho sp. 1070 TaxID=1437364 RepID=UPI00094929AB|nr:glycosyltransferase family 4 protein [Thermosipho sp. 1070]ANQ53651.1 glycosyl transferase [Thermosipho sp. 1070]